jgi:hypothetical protein
MRPSPTSAARRTGDWKERASLFEQNRRLGIVFALTSLLGAGIASLIRPNTRVIFCESPGSQTMEVQDIPAIAEVEGLMLGEGQPGMDRGPLNPRFEVGVLSSGIGDEQSIGVLQVGTQLANRSVGVCGIKDQILFPGLRLDDAPISRNVCRR